MKPSVCLHVSRLFLDTPMRRLSMMDNLFLLMERRHVPLHVGALSLFRPPPDAPPDFCAQLAKRLNQSSYAAPPFNTRLGQRLGRKVWINDAEFDLTHHFVHLALPRPGTLPDLLSMVSRMHSAHLDRAYPMWRTYLIEGLDGGGIATYSKIHHSVADGIASIRLMLKSMSPDALTSLGMPPPWEFKPATVRVRSPVAALAHCPGKTLETARLAYRQVKLVAKELAGGESDSQGRRQAPPTLFNGSITASRRFVARSYPAAAIKTIASRLGGTSNDVVLALCATALRSYLEEQDALPDAPLVAMVPVSTRRNSGETGNEFSASLVDLATHKHDPIERFRVTKASMDRNKRRLQRMSPAQLLAYNAGLLGPGLLSMLPGTRRGLANVVISTVPGPSQPQYWQGCRLEALYPASLLIDGLGLNISLVTRGDSIDFGLLVCPRSLPGPEHLLDHIDDALGELAGSC